MILLINQRTFINGCYQSTGKTAAFDQLINNGKALHTFNKQLNFLKKFKILYLNISNFSFGLFELFKKVMSKKLSWSHQQMILITISIQLKSRFSPYHHPLLAQWNAFIHTLKDVSTCLMNRMLLILPSPYKC